MYVEASGRGAPVVLLHGWGLNLHIFDAVRPALQATHRVIATDLPGHGRSPWDPRAVTLAGQATILGETLRDLTSCDEPCDLVGWSLGGQIALQLAASRPDLVRCMVLIATTPRFTRSKDWPHGTSLAALEAFARELDRDWRSAVGGFLELQVRGSLERDRVLRDLRGALAWHGEPDRHALAAGLRLLATADLRAELATVARPALVVAGQYDRVTPPDACRALAGQLPAARFAEIRRAGHAPFLSHPDEVARLVLEFLA